MGSAVLAWLAVPSLRGLQRRGGSLHEEWRARVACGDKFGSRRCESLGLRAFVRLRRGKLFAHGSARVSGSACPKARRPMKIFNFPFDRFLREKF